MNFARPFLPAALLLPNFLSSCSHFSGSSALQGVSGKRDRVVRKVGTERLGE